MGQRNRHAERRQSYQSTELAGMVAQAAPLDARPGPAANKLDRQRVSFEDTQTAFPVALPATIVKTPGGTVQVQKVAGGLTTLQWLAGMVASSGVSVFPPVEQERSREDILACRASYAVDLATAIMDEIAERERIAERVGETGRAMLAGQTCDENTAVTCAVCKADTTLGNCVAVDKDGGYCSEECWEKAKGSRIP